MSKPHDWDVTEFINTWQCKNCRGHYFNRNGDAPGPFSHAFVGPGDFQFNSKGYTDCNEAQVARVIVE